MMFESKVIEYQSERLSRNETSTFELNFVRLKHNKNIRKKNSNTDEFKIFKKTL